MNGINHGNGGAQLSFSPLFYHAISPTALAMCKLATFGCLGLMVDGQYGSDKISQCVVGAPEHLTCVMQSSFTQFTMLKPMQEARRIRARVSLELHLLSQLWLPDYTSIFLSFDVLK
jgi:hypothetical protein